MKKILVITLVTLLSGCYKQVDRFQLERAIEICEGLDKIIYINAFSVADDDVRCYQFEEIKLIKK